MIDPTSPSTVYAGTFVGIFKTTNGGASWTAASNGLSSMTVNGLALDSSSPLTVYAGTSGGVFKTVNGAASWIPMNDGLTSLGIQAIAIDPTSPPTLYASTVEPYRAGTVFKSTNGGVNWTAVNSGLSNQAVRALAIDSSTPATVYAGAGGGLFRSRDGGTSWTSASTGLASPLAYTVAIDPIIDVEKYPAISFKSKRAAAVSPGRYKVTGDLTLHGVTKEVVLDVEGPTPEIKDPWGNIRRGASASTRINRKDFGVSYNKLLEAGGAVVGDEVTITIDVEMVIKADAPAAKSSK